jgi:multidrug efflux pump subunit AcrB
MNGSAGRRPFAARHRALVLLATAVLAAGGVLAAMTLPSGIYPEVEFPRIVVVARERDVPPQEAQKSLARPLESALATVLGVERVRSRAIRGAVEISLLFAPGTDMWRALQMTESRVAEARAELPSSTEVVVERLTTTSFPVVTFNLTATSGSVDPRRLRELGDLVLRPALSRVHGVGRIEVLGGDLREVEVVLDPERTAALHLRPADIAERVRASTVLATVGRLEESRELVTVMASAEPRDLADLAAIPVATAADGSPVPLSAVGRVFDGAEDRFVRVSGPGGETVLVSVSRLPGASTPDVVGRVVATARQVAAGFPAGVRLEPVYDQADLVGQSMRSVRDAILIGIALCVAVIGVFLRSARAGVVAALAVPVTFSITLLVAALAGQSLNLMSLGGLAVAIGLVIDDAIVVVEAIGRRVDGGEPAEVAAWSGPRALLAALIGTTATTVVVFVPLVRLEGVVGRFFSALAVTLAAAVILSLAVALTLVPLLAARWPPPRARRRTIRTEPSEGSAPPATGDARQSRPSPTRFMLGDRYLRLVRPLLRRPGWLAAACGGLVVAGVLVAREVPSGFLPTMDEGAFVLDYFLPAGTSLGETDTVARKLEAILKRDPDVATYSRRTGAELGPAAATEVNRGDIMVRLKPAAQRHRDAEEVIAGVRASIAREVPEARTEYVQVLQDVLNDLAGTPRPIEIKIFGDDYRVLQGLAQQVADRVRGVPGLVDLYPGFEDESPELRFRIDAAAAARFGKTPADVAADLDTSLRGAIAAVFRRADRPINVRVRYPDEVRFDPARVETLALAWGPAGATPVSAVARAQRAAVPTMLRRENLRPVVVATADHEGRDLGSVARDVERRLRGLTLPEGYTLEIGGQYESQQRTFAELAVVLGFGLLAVLVVLVAQFRAARHALLVLATVPLALVGAVLTLYLTSTPLNASSLMGCVLLVGLVVKNGILLVERFEALRGDSVEEAVLAAGAERVRPILMTTIATLAGLAPLALGIGAGADLQRPLAVAVVGGLVVSTGVTLLALPAFVRLAWPRSLASPAKAGEAAEPEARR